MRPIPTLTFVSLLAFGSLTFGQLKKITLDQPIGEQVAIPKPRPAEIVALEGPVDPRSYRLGPGDQMEFGVWGGIELQEDVTVAPDGNLALPNVGIVPVAGLTLADAESLVAKTAAQVYPRARVTLRLTGVRKLLAAVSGAVMNPGTYELTAVDRLSALIAMAGGFWEPEAKPTTEEPRHKGRETADKTGKEKRPLEEVPEPLPSQRHIVITDRAGQSRSVDYLRYIRTGDAGYNPVLTDGDQVHIPVIDREVGTLNIFGAVKSPGEYEYVPGDRVRDLVELAGSARSDAMLEAVEIVRFNGFGETVQILTADISNPAERGPELMMDDRLFIRAIPKYRQKQYVKVTGEVKYPGLYPIEEDQVKLTDIITACGGFTLKANLENARVRRWSLTEVEDPEFDRLSAMTVAEMSNMEYEYFKNRSREEAPEVVVDFVKLFQNNNKALDIVLKDKDEIEVPPLLPTVKVAGQVNNPGLVNYEPGKSYEYYINKTGGYSWNARKSKLRLIKAQSGTWLKPHKSTQIDIGDTIFVPEKKEYEYWELVKDILLVTTQVATIIVVTRTVR
jgi:protein involved in polysaccharide export with SLBB domain